MQNFILNVLVDLLSLILLFKSFKINMFAKFCIIHFWFIA